MSAAPILPDEIERRVLVQYAVSTALARSETVSQAASAVLAEIGVNLGWDFGSVWLPDEETDQLKAVAIWPETGPATPFRDSTVSSRFSRGDGLPGRVWESGSIEWMPDAAAIHGLPRGQSARADGIRAALAFPLFAGSVFIGVVEFVSRTLRQPDLSMQHALSSLGYQIGEFIARKQAIQASHAVELRTAATLQVALDCIVMIDGEGNVVEFNPAAERTFGYARADVIGKKMRDLIIPPRLRDDHERGFRRYLATGEATILGRRIEISAMRADGSEFPVELAIARVPVKGPPVFTAYLRDLTEHRRLEESRRLLLDASMTLGSSLNPEQTLRNLSKVVLPGFADWYAADVVDADGTVRRVETVHRDPEKLQIANELTRRYPPRVDDPRGIHEVIRTGRSQMVAEISDEMLAEGAVDAEHLALVRGLGLRSYLVVPMRARSGVVGALTLVSAESGRRYDEQDLAIGEELGRRAGQAIENSRLFAALDEQRQLLEQQASELEAQAAELEDTTSKLESTVEELKVSNEDLLARSREADDANKAKSNFLASMSHELRTPLNAIIGYSQLLEIGVHGAVDDKQREDLGRISRSAQHLLGLINDILNYAKVEAGRVEYEIEAVAVRPVLTRVEEMIAPQAKAKDIEYSVSDDCPGERVCADPEKLTQVVVNLLSNAVRYTEPGGHIGVHCWRNADRVVIDVTDTGIGIAADKLGAIFEPFVQVSQEYSSQRQGTGLGLAISRDLARGMGGELTVKSTLGKGSTFTLMLKAETASRGPQAK